MYKTAYALNKRFKVTILPLIAKPWDGVINMRAWFTDIHMAIFLLPQGGSVETFSCYNKSVVSVHYDQAFEEID